MLIAFHTWVTTESYEVLGVFGMLVVVARMTSLILVQVGSMATSSSMICRLSWTTLGSTGEG